MGLHVRTGREVARANALHPITSHPAAYVACSGWDLDRLVVALLDPERYRPPPGREQIASAVGMLALRIVVPDDGHHFVPIEKVIEIRKRYGADFAALYDQVQSVADDLAHHLASVTEPAVLDAYLRSEVTDRFERPLEELRRQIRGLKLNTTTATLSVKFEVPALVSLAGGGLPADRPILAGGSAVAAGLLGLYGTMRGQRATVIQPSAATYLLQTSRHLDASGLLGQVSGMLRRLGARTLRSAHSRDLHVGGAL